jgi:hypothetical protein
VMDVMMVVVMMMLGELTTGKRVRTGGYAFTTSQRYSFPLLFVGSISSPSHLALLTVVLVPSLDD